MGQLLVTQFKGQRNDKGELNIESDRFYRINNFNYDNIIGANKILFPEKVNETEFSTGSDIDGIFEYKYLDSMNVLRTETITVTGGEIWKNWDSAPAQIFTGLTPGKVTFATYQDKLFIFNGQDYPHIYWGEKGTINQMGAPTAVDTGIAGAVVGPVYYAITYVTAGGEEVVGSISNTVNPNNKRVDLFLPVGYAGTLTRKVYRTSAGGSILKLLTSIGDNTTTSYTDNTLDSALGGVIPSINNELPRPYFVEVLQQRLVGGVEDKYPTQIYVTDTNIEIFDKATFVDVSNIGRDNTPIKGLIQQYGLIIVGTEKDMYTIDVTSSPITVTPTRTNIGVKNGYSMEAIPDEGGFNGGIIFVSTLNDIRIFNGNIKTAVSTSLDNLRTENYSQVIRQTLENDLQSASNLYGQYFDYKYHLLVDNKIYIYETRIEGWSEYVINSDDPPTYQVAGIANNSLYLGKLQESTIEKSYADIEYNGQDMEAFIETPQLLVSEDEKYFKELAIYYGISANSDVKVQITVENENDTQIVEEFTITGGVFDSAFYNPLYYKTGNASEDYKVFYINRYGRWIKVRVTCDKGNFYFKGFRMLYDEISNKEG